MDNKLEIVTFKANSYTVDGIEVSWLFSRSQLEFIIKDIEIFTSSPLSSTAQYGGAMLPVINLEHYFGLENRKNQATGKYLVLRTVADNELLKIIVETPQQVKVHDLGAGRPQSSPTRLPKNNESVLGCFSLSDGTVGVMPNIAIICRSLEWPKK